MKTFAKRAGAVGLAIGVAAMAGAAGPSGRWLGQDGHDFVGKAAAPGPSDIQDLHFAFAGLPAGARIVSGTVRADGGGEWKFGGPPGSWLAHAVQPPGGTTADVYIEPYQLETGRGFDFGMVFEDGRETTVRVLGGKADPNARVASARLEARWGGQDGRDVVGPNPNAGPDGIRDVHLGLARVAAKEEVRSILVAGPGALRWQFGPNPEGHPRAELVRPTGDPARGELFFHPARDLNGQTLKLTVHYASGLIDTASVTAGRCDPGLKVTVPPLPPVEPIAIKATWLGQGRSGDRRGDVAVALGDLPGRIRAVDLSDGDVGRWSTQERSTVPDALPLTFRRATDSGRVEVAFSPVRDEAGATMTLRLLMADGRSIVGSFPGGSCDPSLRSEAPAATSVAAKPGDDLNDLANRYGTVTLAPGSYTLARPLILDRPVTLTSAGGAEIVFAQGWAEPAWKAAIEVRAGRTTLERLSVRFAGPVRWDQGISYGPAVIGTSGGALAGLRFTGLEIEGPHASSAWEETPRALRLTGATDGAIEGNRIRAGMIQLWGGPWKIAGNVFEGTPAGTFAHAALAVNEPHDMTIERNRVRPVDPRGKLWRWLVLVNRGSNVRVAENTIEGVGPRDDDAHEHPNAPETVLTESYRLSFEGKALATSPDGRVVQIPAPPGQPIRVGDVLAILSGPEAGRWRRVVMPLGSNAYLLDGPVALRGGAIAIGPGFVGTSFDGNSIDDRGSKVAFPFVLAGQHFGTQLVRNTTRGGGGSVRAVATATEAPGPWGWSHTAMFGLLLEGNTFEDARDGATLIVEHNQLTRPSRGRVYATAKLANNLFSATPRPPTSSGAPAGTLTIGEPPSGDPGELVVTESGNRARGFPGKASIRVRTATVNGRAISDGRIDLAPETGTAGHREPSSGR
jgi:hypothetical protein